jgi:hypothetical protein
MNMKFLSTVVAIAVTGTLCSSAFAASDVAAGAVVSYTGSGFGGSSSTWGAGVFTPSIITSATALTDGTQWNTGAAQGLTTGPGTAFWNGTSIGDPSQWLTITLGQTATVSSIVLQADNNDAYQVLYHNGSGWTPLAIFGGVGGWGLATRPEQTFSAVTTDAFRIVAADGDGYYSVGHFTANGVPAVPEPETYAMMMAGLALVGGMARRRKVAQQ